MYDLYPNVSVQGVTTAVGLVKRQGQTGALQSAYPWEHKAPMLV